MRVGIFGGTFDPVHMGHLILAELAREAGELDQVWFVPAPRPPQKDGQSITRFEQRVEMLELAIAGQPAFRIDPIENERSGPSYTVETLRTLHQRYPADQFWLLLGGDSLADIPYWREPKEIVSRAGLLVMARPGVKMVSEEQLRSQLQLGDKDAFGLKYFEAPQIDIASRDLRRRVREGKTIRYTVPRSVEVYLQERNLYRET